jgi:hypothetical protein
MSKDKISDYSATANSNTDIAGINIDEGCAPSGINNAIRTLMKQLKDWQSGSQDVYITPAGSVSAPAVTTTGDTNTGVYFPAADKVAIATGGTQAVIVDSSQNVGIGTSSPSVKLHVKGGNNNTAYLDNDGSQYTTSFLLNNGTGKAYWSWDNTNAAVILGSDTASSLLTFKTAGSERMRIDSSGNLLVGAASSAGAYKVQIYSTNLATTTNGVLVTNGANSTGGYFHAFQNYVGTIIGSISQATSTTVNYATSSDYRLKENVQPMTGALATVSQLKPVNYTWKLDGSSGQGFIAHELAEVFPEAVVGEKDAVDEKGNPKYQGIDTSFLVATLTAAIQEQQAIITSLTARIEALENK